MKKKKFEGEKSWRRLKERRRGRRLEVRRIGKWLKGQKEWNEVEGEQY